MSSFTASPNRPGTPEPATTGFIVRGCCDSASSARYRRGIFVAGGGVHAMSIYSTNNGCSRRRRDFAGMRTVCDAIPFA
jgi:hypothetical protein